MEISEMVQVASAVGTRFGLRVVGAIALWVIGRAVIAFCGRLVSRALMSQRVEPTLGRYIGSAISIVRAPRVAC